MSPNQIAWVLLTNPDFAKQAGLGQSMTDLLNRVTAAGSGILKQTTTAGGIATPFLAAALGFGRGKPDQLPPRQIRQPAPISQPAPAKTPLHAPAPGDM